MKLTPENEIHLSLCLFLWNKVFLYISFLGHLKKKSRLCKSDADMEPHFDIFFPHLKKMEFMNESGFSVDRQ